MMLINADARLIPLANESVGMILTSPPYNVGLNYEGFDDNLTEDEHKDFSFLWLTEAYRVMKDTGRLYVIVSDKMLWWFKDLAESSGWIYVQNLTWCKPNLCRGTTAIKGDWNYMTENVLLFRKGKNTPMLSGDFNTFSWFIETVPQSNYNGGRIHPAQLPVSLCEKIISRTPGNPILDPFCGSGSVMVAAKKLDRPFIGFDLVNSVCKKAKKRIDQTPIPLIKDNYIQNEFMMEKREE